MSLGLEHGFFFTLTPCNEDVEIWDAVKKVEHHFKRWPAEPSGRSYMPTHADPETNAQCQYRVPQESLRKAYKAGRKIPHS